MMIEKGRELKRMPMERSSLSANRRFFISRPPPRDLLMKRTKCRSQKAWLSSLWGSGSSSARDSSSLHHLARDNSMDCTTPNHRLSSLPWDSAVSEASAVGFVVAASLPPPCSRAALDDGRAEWLAGHGQGMVSTFRSEHDSNTREICCPSHVSGCTDAHAPCPDGWLGRN